MSLQCLPSSFGSIGPTVWVEMLFVEFQNGRHPGFQNKMILAILNLYVTLIPPIKFQLNLTWYQRRCRLKNLKMAAGILEWNNFSNSESHCHSNAFHQFSTWVMSFEEFQAAIGTERFLQF